MVQWLGERTNRRKSDVCAADHTVYGSGGDNGVRNTTGRPAANLIAADTDRHFRFSATDWDPTAHHTAADADRHFSSTT